MEARRSRPEVRRSIGDRLREIGSECVFPLESFMLSTCDASSVGDASAAGVSGASTNSSEPDSSSSTSFSFSCEGDR